MKTEIQQNQWGWLRVPLAHTIALQIVVFVLSFIGAMTLTPGYNDTPRLEETWMREGYPSLWMRWDTEWYVEVATFGYRFIPDQLSEVGYFPVYPMLMRYLGYIVGNPLVAGLVISNVAILFAMALLYRLVLTETNAWVARRTLFYLVLFPGAFFFVAAYTESLFLLLTVIAAYAAREKRWLIAAITGIVASATRVQGFLIVALVGVEWLNAHGWTLREIFKAKSWQIVGKAIRTDWKNLLLIMLIPSGLIMFMIFQWVNFGTPFAFVQSHTAIDTDVTAGPINVIVGEIRDALDGTNENPYVVPLGFATTLFALVTVVPIFRRLRESWAVYVALLIALPAWSGPLWSMTRFVIVMFPVFVIWAMWSRNKVLHLTYFAIATPLLCLMTIFFIRWLLVA
jgi:hypothetical protein